MERLCCVLIGLLLILAVAPVESRTWYVKLDGTGDAPTIQAGIDSAEAGDDVLVGPGTYTKTNQGTSTFWQLVLMKSGVSLYSEHGPAVTTLDAEMALDSVIRCEEIANVVIEGFTITRGTDTGAFVIGGGGVCCAYSSGITIRGNVVVDNRTTGVWQGLGGAGIYTGGSSGIIIEENIIVDNHGDEVANGGGITTWDDIIIRNNVIANNSAGEGGGIYVYSTATIYNNTFVGNSSPLGAAILARATPSIRNNIICGSVDGYAIHCAPDGTPIITCNDLWDNAGGHSNCPLDPDNIFADPLFCDEASGKYYIQENSPCAPDNSPMGCGLIGAFPVGCQSVPLGTVCLGILVVGLAALGGRVASRNK